MQTTLPPAKEDINVSKEFFKKICEVVNRLMSSRRVPQRQRDDIRQDCFMAITRSLKTYKSKGKYLHYCTMVASRAITDSVRLELGRGATRKNSFTSLDEMSETASILLGLRDLRVEEPYNILQAKEARQFIQKCSTKQEDFIVQAKIDGWNIEDIARDLQITPYYVRRALWKATLLLREYYHRIA